MHLESLAAQLRPIPTIGARVAVRASRGEPLQGTFFDRTTYADGTPAALVELDRGAVAVVPVGDLEVLS